MDFVPLHKGILHLALTAAASLNIGLTPTPSPSPQISIQEPALIESRNLPAEVDPENSFVLTSLSEVTKTDEVNLKMVVKEPEPFENNLLVTVEEPKKVFTVLEPTPKPKALSKSEDSENEETKKPEESAEPSKKPESSKEPAKTEKTDAKSEQQTESPKPSDSPKSDIPLNSSNAEKLFQMANDHRSKIGKPAFEKEERLCKIAEQRAPQVDGELAAGKLHAGFKALNLPYWATENIAAYTTIEQDFKFWITDYIHKVAIESDHKYSCVACQGASCSQIFSSFVPK